MGTCKYCGQSAGLLSHAHKECEEKHSKGVAEFKSVVDSYFMLKASTSEIQRIKSKHITDAFLSDDDICEVSDAAIRLYTSRIRRPFPPSSLKIIDEFIHACGLSFSKINSHSAVDGFTKKLIKGFMVEYFTDKLPLATAHARCEKVLAKLPMSQTQIEDAYLYVLNKAASNFLQNGILSDDEQRKIDDYISLLSLPVNNLPVPYQNSEIDKLGQATILKEIQRGKIPNSAYAAPIILGKSEAILWAYHGVNLYQEKITKEWVGRSGGFSFRVFKGVYYRTGRMKGHPVEHSSMEHQGIGTLYITNKNLIFYSTSKSLKIPFTKLIGLTPYSDGIEVHKDGANVRRITLQGFEPWFVMNLLSVI